MRSQLPSFASCAQGREFCLDNDVTVTTNEFHEMVRQQVAGGDKFVSVVVFIDEEEDGEGTEIQFEAFQCSKQAMQVAYTFALTPRVCHC